MAADRRPLSDSPDRAGLRRRLSQRLAPLSSVSDGWWVVVAVVVFIAVTIWWLTQDNRVPDHDEGSHLLDAFAIHAELVTGHLTAPFTEFNNYPPLVHLVGALGVFIGGLHESAVILADNFVFVPVLAAGCYGVGCIAYGRRAGLLAALFALGAPMIVSEMREYYVDPGEAAMAAVSVWAILASRRFERVGMSALAGLLCALGMLSKETFPFFVGGVLIVVLVRGGWRHWRGLLAFLATLGAIGLPWYIYHFSELHGLTAGATTSAVFSPQARAGGAYPTRFSGSNVLWYFWNLFNHQLLTPLTALFLIGTVLAVWRFARRRDANDLTPELIVGGLVAYLGMTYINLKDPRYTLPALVYMAVLGTGWIATARPRLRAWATAALGVFVAANFIAVSFGFGPTVAIRLPGAPASNLAGARVLTFYSPTGWLRGGPERDGDLLGLLKALKRVGFTQAEFDFGSAQDPDFSQAGLGALSVEAALPEPQAYSFGELGPRDAYLVLHLQAAGDPPPCQRLHDGYGVYVVPGNPQANIWQKLTFVCPGHRPLYYRRTAPLPEIITHVITGTLRGQLLTLMGAMRRQGHDTIEFDLSNMYNADIDPLGLDQLATISGLKVPPAYQPQTLGPRDAFMFRHIPVAGDPPPCLRLSDGSGVYIVFGNPLIPFGDYEFYCPTRTPHLYRRG